jgi:lipopolysaccharide heptosyltransferase I
MTASKQVPLREYPASRIALIKPSALGDIVHSLPVLTALRRRYPQAHISWVVNRAYEPLLQGHPDLNETLSFDRGMVRTGMLQAGLTYTRFLTGMRRQHFDLVIDLQGLLRSGLMTAATGATRRVGFDSAREGARWFYTDVIAGADRGRVHAVDRYWLVAEALGVGDAPRTFHVPISEIAHEWAEAALAGCVRPWLFLAVGSRWVTKRWPPAHFAALARQAQDQFGGTVVFIGAGDEKELAREAAALLLGPSRDLTGQTSLPQLAALLARADVVIANDTGPLHLANALGRPVIAPYTCTSVRLTGPYGVAVGAVETRIWCQGRYLKRCPRLECMAELTPERLWPPLERVLLQWESTGCRSA